MSLIIFRLEAARAIRADRSFRDQVELVDDHFEGLIRIATTPGEADELIVERREHFTRLARCWTAGHPQRN